MLCCCTFHLQIAQRDFERFHEVGPLFCGAFSSKHNEWLNYVNFACSSGVCMTAFCDLITVDQGRASLDRVGRSRHLFRHSDCVIVFGHSRTLGCAYIRHLKVTAYLEWFQAGLILT